MAWFLGAPNYKARRGGAYGAVEFAPTVEYLFPGNHTEGKAC